MGNDGCACTVCLALVVVAAYSTYRYAISIPKSCESCVEQHGWWCANETLIEVLSEVDNAVCVHENDVMRFDDEFEPLLATCASHMGPIPCISG